MSNNKNQKTDEKKEETAQTQTVETQPTDVPAQEQARETQPTDISAQEHSSGLQKTDTEAKTVKMVLKHKSHTTNYHRCGLTLTKVFAEYEVPAECVDKIKADKWIVVQESK